MAMKLASRSKRSVRSQIAYRVSSAMNARLRGKIARSGGTAAAYACNVADQANVKAVFVEMASASPIDILVNCAGISHVGKLETTPEADFDRVFAVNVKGTYNCMFAVI